MTAIVLKKGRVIDPSQHLDTERTVIIRDGRISGIYPPGDEPPVEEDVLEFNVDGLVVCPGFIDLHVHLRDPGEEWKEDIASGTLAAARGGFTTVVAMPNTIPPNDTPQVTAYIVRRAREVGHVRVVPAGRIVRADGTALSPFGEMVEAGACAFTDDGSWTSDAQLMERAMEYAKAFGVPLLSHPEEPALSCGGQINEGQMSLLLGLKGIPSQAEEVAVFRDIKLAELTGGHLHLQHISTKGSVELVKLAKEKGMKNITCEVTPHHFSLTEEAVEGFNTSAKVKPPLRTEDDRQALLLGLRDGTIDCIATDHAPHSELEKKREFNEAAFGISGLETALPLSLNLVRNGHISLSRLVELLSVNPARIISSRGGTLKPGAPADVTVFDPDLEWEVTPEALASRGKNTPFLGKKLRGRVVITIVEGRIVHSVLKV